MENPHFENDAQNWHTVSFDKSSHAQCPIQRLRFYLHQPSPNWNSCALESIACYLKQDDRAACTACGDSGTPTTPLSGARFWHERTGVTEAMEELTQCVASLRTLATTRQPAFEEEVIALSEPSEERAPDFSPYVVGRASCPRAPDTPPPLVGIFDSAAAEMVRDSSAPKRRGETRIVGAEGSGPSPVVVQHAASPGRPHTGAMHRSTSASAVPSLTGLQLLRPQGATPARLGPHANMQLRPSSSPIPKLQAPRR